LGKAMLCRDFIKVVACSTAQANWALWCANVAFKRRLVQSSAALAEFLLNRLRD
jgi:hypothetical protein